MSTNRHLMTRDEYRHQKKENVDQVVKTTNKHTTSIDVSKENTNKNKSTNWQKPLLYVIAAIVAIWLIAKVKFFFGL